MITKIRAAQRLLADKEKGWKVLLSFQNSIHDDGWNSISYEFKPSHTIRTEEDARKAAIRKLKQGRSANIKYKIVRVNKIK